MIVHKYDTEITDAELISVAQLSEHILENHNAWWSEHPGGAYEIRAPLSVCWCESTITQEPSILTITLTGHHLLLHGIYVR